MTRDTLQTAIELCLAVYRITDKFPRGEILRTKIRVRSIDVIENLVYNGAKPAHSGGFFDNSNLEKNLRSLFACFKVAGKQGWVDAKNFEILRDAYQDLYRAAANPAGSDPAGLAGREHAPAKAKPQPSQTRPKLSERQRKILKFLETKKSGSAVSDIAKNIEASSKTAERELKKLITAKFVRKQGNTKGARFITDK